MVNSAMTMAINEHTMKLNQQCSGPSPAARCNGFVAQGLPLCCHIFLRTCHFRQVEYKKIFSLPLYCTSFKHNNNKLPSASADCNNSINL
jgi:hypothetical protein